MTFIRDAARPLLFCGLMRVIILMWKRTTDYSPVQFYKREIGVYQKIRWII